MVRGGKGLRVVVIGGGVGAWELALGLRKLAADLVQTTVITPDAHFRYMPSSVAVPFRRGEVYRFSIEALAGASGAKLVPSTVTSVDTAAYTARIADGDTVRYDALVVATGARRLPVLKGAIPFRGEEDIAAVEAVLDEITRRTVDRVAFALPGTATWSLPLYELALLTGAYVADHHVPGVELTFVTPEDEPLAVFGGEASRKVDALLGERRVALVRASYPAGFYDGVLMLVPARTIPADRVICMPEARGVVIDGLPHDYSGFLTVDPYGRVANTPDVYGVGDITNQPIKQGGIAAQQADIVAQLLARQAGAQVEEPEPHRPTLRALLLTGDEPQYLESRPAGGHGAAATPSNEPLWWPGGKIAARYLGPYLAQAERVKL
ncbi:MAG TPA: FAD-dependent oxidoreductase [Gaiellales bacterium]|jgi:sulfide:quinone oxidoreductase|nr:FAD-dependent oxidoreductase [Gaiellales bacterium]